MGIKNAKTLPKVYYGLHMVQGVAEYADPAGDPYRVLILENAIKEMDPTFSGRPVYVKHKDEVNLDKLQEEADGYVVRSFYNKSDGQHWVEFIVVSDKAHDAVRNGWKLSNAYVPKEFAGAGRWHNVDYAKEVTRAEYEHLAIVPNPRYEESIILTPEEFKTYNSDKELELSRLTNSKGDPEMKLNFFKKTKVEKVENAADLEGVSVTLKSGSEKTILQLVNEAEAAEDLKKKNDEAAAAGEKPMANGDHMVSVGEEKMSVNELVEKYNALKAPKQNEEKSAEEKAAEEKKKNDEIEAKKKADEESAKKHQNEIEAAAKKKKEAEDNFNKIANAHLDRPEVNVIDTSDDKFARGRARYGSK